VDFLLKAREVLEIGGCGLLREHLDSLAGRLDRSLGVLVERQTNPHHIERFLLQHLLVMLIHAGWVAAGGVLADPPAVLVGLALGIGCPLNVPELGNAAQEDLGVAIAADEADSNRGVSGDLAGRLSALYSGHGQTGSGGGPQEFPPAD